MHDDEILVYARPWPDPRGATAEVWTYNRGLSRRVVRRPGTVSEAIKAAQAEYVGQDGTVRALAGGAASLTFQVDPV